jgi:hypothetical protein
MWLSPFARFEVYLVNRKFLRETRLHSGQSPMPIEQTLSKSHAVGLAGQAFLDGVASQFEYMRSPSSKKAASESQMHKHEHDVLNQTITSIHALALATKSVSGPPSPGLSTLLIPVHLDWCRIGIQLGTIFAFYNIKPGAYKRYYEAWISLGDALQFEFLSPHRCAYARCYNHNLIPYGVLRVCGSCPTAYYCSHACQHG